MLRQASFLVVLLGVAACGGSDEDILLPDNGLQAPPVTGAPTSSSGSAPSGSSSSGSAQPPVDPGGSSSSGSSSGSTPVEEAPCSPSANLGPFAPVPGIPAEASWLRLTGNELEAFYVMPGPSTSRIYSSTRASLADPFGTGLELNGDVNHGSYVSEPIISDDGLTLRFSVNASEVYQATRSSTTGSFGSVVLARGGATSEVLSRDGTVLFSRRERVGGIGGFYLWFVYGQAPGGGEVRVRAAQNNQPFATWYEPLSHQAWVGEGDLTQIYTWDGAWHAGGNTDFRVSWTSPNGCRLYGRQGNAIVMRSRVPGG